MVRLDVIMHGLNAFGVHCHSYNGELTNSILYFGVNAVHVHTVPVCHSATHS